VGDDYCETVLNEFMVFAEGSNILAVAGDLNADRSYPPRLDLFTSRQFLSYGSHLATHYNPLKQTARALDRVWIQIRGMFAISPLLPSSFWFEHRDNNPSDHSPIGCAFIESEDRVAITHS